MENKMNWLFLRGLSREMGHWGDTFEVFERTNPGMKVHGLDYPGIGTESERQSPLTVNGIMQDLRSRFKILKEHHPGPWSILAISLGGMVTLEWLKDYPEDFGHAVVVNSSAKNVSNPLDRFSPGALASYIKGVKDFKNGEMERTVLETVCNLAVTDELVAQWRDIAILRPLSKRTVATQMLAGSQYETPDHVTVPTLIIGSTKDRLVSVKCSERIAAHLNLPIIYHPEAGHDLSTDDAQWMADKVGEWVTTGEVPRG
jgi:alpha-beta hydrolase superfamily lysophospholipase